MAAARCPLLLEREYELAVLASSLGSLFAGSGGALTLMGGTGLGKTRIASELARAASARGAVVLWVGVEPDGVCGEPFGALARLVRSAIAAGASETGGTAALFGRARTALGLDHGPAAAMPPAVDMCPEPVAARGLVAELVEQLCERQPVVVIFDDFHHAAPETVSSGQLLARDSAELPLLVVVTSASTDGSELGVGLRVELSPLTEPAVRQMITSCWHDEVPDELVTALIEHAKGVPLFVEELLAAALDDHEGRVPVSFASSVGRRLRNREVTRRVLEVAALLGTTFEWWLVAEIVSSPAHEVLNALQDGIDLGVLGPDDGSDARLFRFRSEATRDAVLSELAPARRCDHATAALAVLEQRYPGLPGARLFQAAVLAEQAGRRDRAGALWSEAGSRCLALGAFQEAGRCFARAGEVAGAGRPEGTAWGVVSVVDPLEVALGRARAYAGAGAEADVERALAELRQAVQAEAIADLERARQRAAAAHTAIGFGLLWGGRVMHAAAELSLARECAGDASAGTDDPALALLAAGVAAADGRLDEARRLAEHVATTTSDQPKAAAFAMWGWVEAAKAVAVRAVGGETAAATREARQVGAVRARGHDLVNLGPAIRLLRDSADRADRAGLVEFALHTRRVAACLAGWSALDPLPIETVRNAAAAARLPRLVVAIDAELAELYAARWDRERAHAALWRCRRLAERLGMLDEPGQLALLLAIESEITALTGDRNAVDGFGARLEESGAPDAARLRWLMSVAMVHLVEADLAGALAALDQAGALSPGSPNVASVPIGCFRPFAWQALLQAATSDEQVHLERSSPPGEESHVHTEAFRAGSPDGVSNHRLSPTFAWEQPLWECAAALAASHAGDRDAVQEAAARGLARFAAFGETGARYVALWLVSEMAAVGGWGEPERWSREAVRWFEAAGYPRLAAACRSVLRSTGARVPRRGRGESRVPTALAGLGLTSREVDVLALVAEGLTNKEIARRLFISPRTVGTHIAHLLAKTGTRNRRQLRELAQRHGLADR